MCSAGRNLAEDEQGSKRPSATRTGENTARVTELVRSDRRLIIRMTADEVKVNRETVRLILTEELGMRKIWCQDGAQEYHRTTVGCAIERSF
jgi:hypothetical protein